MLQRVFACTIAFAFAYAIVAPQAQPNVSGSWLLLINGPQGAVDAEASFKQDGDKVTGTMSSPAGEVNVAGTMSGSTLSLAFNVVTPNGPLDVTLTAEVSGADMKGVVDYSMGTADFTGKKK